MNVIIFSPIPNFAGALAEQVGQQLGISCSVVQMPRAVPYTLLVTTEPVDGENVLLTGPPPLRLHKLLSDIENLLMPSSEDILEFGMCRLFLRSKQLVAGEGEESVALTDKEIQLVQCLARVTGSIVPRDQLLKEVWGIDSPLDTHTLETHIYRLRGKLRELKSEDIIVAADGGYGLKV